MSKHPILLLAGLTAALLLSLLFAMGSGSVPLPEHWWTSTPARWPEPAHTVLIQLRLPRAGAALLCGGMLGLAGVLMQTLLRNPLADPYILGISGGAAFAALAVMLAGALSWTGAAAFAGAMISMLLVFSLARGRGNWSPLRLLLTGVIIAAAWNAGISFILAVTPDGTLRGMLFWMMGDLANAQWSNTLALVLLFTTLVSLWFGRTLNIMAMGDTRAQSLGVRVKHIQILIYLLGSLLTAGVVSIAGSIGFVGLVVPHVLRLLGARDHRILVPASVLGGATLLLVADTLARNLIAPQQLPVGVLTALIGAPLFLFLLNHQHRRST